MSKPEEYGLLHQPPNTMPRIVKLWAYVSVDKDGNEGICAAPYGGFPLLPLIAADEARLKCLAPIAQALADISDLKIRLVEFSARTDVRDVAKGH